ncbi:protein toll-like [Prorops nasuta]|uniref:protein toll-like n=1 Tax=Prorops nasuta TaxID=863751 RepID=UPI0034CD5F0D
MLRDVRTIYLLFLLTSGIFCYQCFDGQGCTCQESHVDDLEFYCPIANESSFIINVKPLKYIQVQCRNSPSWTNFQLTHLIENDHLESMYIRMCSLPTNNSFGDITEQLGLKSLDKLVFQSFSNVSNTLRRSHLKKLAKLKQLILSSNNIMNLTHDLLMDLPELQWLDLRDNSVKNLPANLFDQTSQLEVLELGNNLIDSIEPGAFQHLGRLRFLNLWKNQLHDIETNTFSQLTSLHSLDLNNNNLSALPNDIFLGLENLLTLSLYGNNFTSFPQDLFRYNKKLKTINLNNNKRNLTTLPKLLFANLTELKIVRLRKNGLRELPEDLFWGCVSLSNISIEKNYLITLPERIFRDTRQLYILDISFNDIETLPDFLFSNANQLTKLNLSKNRITTISRNLFAGLNSLKELNMNENKLKAIESLSLAPLQKLEIARFSHNKLTLNPTTFQYPDEYGTKSPFEHARNLRELYLDHNHITEIFADWVFAHTLLRILDLRYNNLSSISAYDLQFVSKQIKVDLSHNIISHIYLNEAEEIAKYQSTSRDVIISIENNPLICDCDLYNLLRYLEGEMHPFVQNLFHIKSDNLTCMNENNTQNIKVENLRSKTLRCIVNDRELKKACIKSCECSIEPYSQTYIIDCSYKNLTAININTLNTNDNRKYEISLNLTGNRLTHLPNLDNISVLALSHNNLKNVPLNALNPNIKVLELHSNNITKLNSTILELLVNSTMLKRLTLSGNPWECDCDTKDFVDFVQTNFVQVTDRLNVVCDNKNISLTQLTINELCPLKISVIIGICFTVAFFGLTLGTVIALYYRYQQKIKVWLYAHQFCLWFVTENELDKDKLYDAFISYSHKDEDFVINELVPNLENGSRPFKLCLHYRDWLAGEWIPKQIACSVENSKRTIIILSPNFLESIWGRLEFRTAHCQALNEGRARVIVILYGEVAITNNLDPELKAYLSVNTYVKWGDPWFWDKLKYALPHSSQPPQFRLKNNIFKKQQAHLNSLKKEFTSITSSKHWKPHRPPEIDSIS